MSDLRISIIQSCGVFLKMVQGLIVVFCGRAKTFLKHFDFHFCWRIKMIFGLSVQGFGLIASDLFQSERVTLPHVGLVSERTECCAHRRAPDSPGGDGGV